MDIQLSKDLGKYQTGIFKALTEKKNEVEATGKKLFNMFVGTPDFEVFPHIQKAISEACMNPDNFKYSLVDHPDLLKAVVAYYKKRYGVDLDTTEITSVNGSQEGLSHIGMALCDQGDYVLIPNPGYPAFEVSALFSKGTPYYYDLLEEHHYLPQLDSIPEEVLQHAKYMIVSYPYNPVCATAPAEFYDEVIAFAKKHNIIIVHDNAYSDILYDGVYGGSFLEHEGAKEVGVEFFSLSKSFNLTGARISFVVGNKKIVDGLKLIRSQYDFGMFLPLQYGAIAALTGPLDPVKEQCKKYEARRDALYNGMNDIGWPVEKCQGTMFSWARIPAKYSSSQQFCMDLVEKAGVLCTPGSAFGSNGEGYVRFALVLPPEEIRKMCAAIKESGILE